MTEQPRIVTRTRRVEAPSVQDFPFVNGVNPSKWDGHPLAAYRQSAWTHYTGLPFPTLKDEAWRRTDIKGLETTKFLLPSPEAYLDLPEIPDRLLKPLTDEEHGGQVILLPGGGRSRLDHEISSQGVIFSDLQSAIQKHPELVEKLVGTVVKPSEGKFAALASTFSENGVFVYIPRGIEVIQPLHSLIWGPGAHLAHFSHLVVWLEEGANATYVHEYASPQEQGGQTFHAGIVEVHVGEGANLRFVELQSWGSHVWNFTHERARVHAGGTLEWIFGAIGSAVTKNFSDLDLVGRGATGRISGFYFADGDQHLDHDTQQNHLSPDTTSDLLYKGALEGQSRSVWQGMIYVAPGAIKTDGYQANRNLVLSRKARADSIPGLEILADDVRCTHGATVGKIDPDQVFYLRSRGIEAKEAEKLIVEGFFDPIMQRIPFDGVRQRFQESIQMKMMIK